MKALKTLTIQNKLIVIEKVILLFFILTIPFQKRHIFFSLSPKIAGSYSDFISISIYLSDIALLALLILSLFIKRPLKRPLKLRVLSHFIFLLWVVLIGLALSPRETYAYYQIIKWLELLILSLYIYRVSRENKMKDFIFKSLSISGTIQGLLAATQFIKQSSLNLHVVGETIIKANLNGIAKVDLDGEKLIRAYGTFTHPNQLAGFLVVTCATTILVLLNSKIERKWVYKINLLIILIGLFCSLSRGGIIALFILILFTFGLLLISKKFNKDIKDVFTLNITILVLCLLIFMPALKGRANLTDDATQERINYDKTGIYISRESPLLGKGVATIIPEMEKKLAQKELWQIQPPHNYFIIVACETGLVGVLIFLVSLIRIARNMVKSLTDKIELGQKNYSVILLATWAGIISLMMVDHYFYTLQQTQLLLWLIFGLSAAHADQVSYEAKNQN